MKAKFNSNIRPHLKAEKSNEALFDSGLIISKKAKSYLKNLNFIEILADTLLFEVYLSSDSGPNINF